MVRAEVSQGHVIFSNGSFRFICKLKIVYVSSQDEVSDGVAVFSLRIFANKCCSSY
jgi:hypothetical protein